MAAMFTTKDLEVYKDSLKEKNRTSKTADKPPVWTPPSVAKVSKPPLKPNNERPLKERKPLSVMHKATNTIKDPPKPSSPTPVGSSKQADQWRRSKETTSKSPPGGKIPIADVNPLIKASEYKTDSLKNPKEALPSKSPHIKSDDSKASGAHKQSTHVSPVYQKSLSLSGAKAAPTVDASASLCSECLRSASEGAVCFIGNDGRVSACTTRSAVRLCKNLNCAANNPEYVAAMANAPKKYLISKRHLLKAQYGPKSRSNRTKLPNVHHSDAAEYDGTCPCPESVSPSIEELSPLNADWIASSCAVESDDGNLSLLGGDLRPFGDEMSLLNGNLGIDKDDIGWKSDGTTSVQDVAVDEHSDFNFHDGEVAEPESPKFLVMESSKEFNETHSAGGIESCNEDAESLAIENFEEPDDEDLDGNSSHTESKAEELSINYGDLMPSEEADVEDLSSNMVEHTARSPMRDEGASMTEVIDNPLPTGDGEMGSREGNPTGAKFCTTDCDQNAGNNQESFLPQTASIKQVVYSSGVDESIPLFDCKQPADDNNGAGQIIDDKENGDLATLDAAEIAHDSPKGSDTDSGDVISLSVVDEQQDDHSPLHKVDDESSGVTTSPTGKQVDGNEGGMMSLHGIENEESDDDTSSIHDNGHEENEVQSDEEESEDDTLDANLRGTSAIEENTCIDAAERKEDTLSERVTKNQDGGKFSVRRQRRRRGVVEEVSPETVILRKQQMQERKQAEEWMLNHAIEGVVHKLAPTGEAKVKVLVEAFETIISHTDVEII